jgi:hypothetical protein
MSYCISRFLICFGYEDGSGDEWTTKRDTDWQDNSNQVYEAEGSVHVQEEVGK